MGRAGAIWGVIALGAAWGCGSVDGSGSSASASGTGGVGAGTTGTTGTGGDISSSGDCPGQSVCPLAATTECLELVDNSKTSQFALRIADLTLTAPPSLTKGLVKGVFQNAVNVNSPGCFLDGGGTFSWLLGFDTVKGTLTTGGAKPVADPAQGYSFVDETLVQGGKSYTIAPVILHVPLQGGAFASSPGGDVILPVYLDIKGSAVMLFPLHGLKLTGKISPHHGCIGKLNPAILPELEGCIPDIPPGPLFTGSDGKPDSDGAFTAHFVLEEADNVIVDAVGQTLCVILSGDPMQYGDGGSPARCKRDAAMKIVFQGDWCDATDTAGCADSVRFSAGFSASAVKVW